MLVSSQAFSIIPDKTDCFVRLGWSRKFGIRTSLSFQDDSYFLSATERSHSEFASEFRKCGVMRRKGKKCVTDSCSSSMGIQVKSLQCFSVYCWALSGIMFNLALRTQSAGSRHKSWLSAECLQTHACCNHTMFFSVHLKPLVGLAINKYFTSKMTSHPVTHTGNWKDGKSTYLENNYNIKTIKS